MKINISDITAILPAAGLGKRMELSYPKQYCLIGNKTVLEHSVHPLLSQSCIKKIIVVINSNDMWFHRLSIARDKRIDIVTGGKTRVASVMLALDAINHSSWVIVHDAVRPLLQSSDLVRLLEVIKYSKIGGVLATPVINTIKRSSCVKKTSLFIYHTINRTNLWHALTPQIFNFKLLKNCLNIMLFNKYQITDESFAVEQCGYHPILVPGRSDNIKITYPQDLKLAKFYLSQLKM